MAVINGDAELIEEATRLFIQTMKRPQRWTAIIRRAGITIDRPAAMILHILVAHPQKQLRVQDIANMLGVEPPSVTRKTQELQQAGYIERLPNPSDKRAVTLQVTQAGHEAAQKIREAQHETLRQTLANWSEKDRETFIKLFQKFTEAFAEQVTKEIETTK